jgi:hypothetical protein
LSEGEYSLLNSDLVAGARFLIRPSNKAAMCPRLGVIFAVSSQTLRISSAPG